MPILHFLEPSKFSLKLNRHAFHWSYWLRPDKLAVDAFREARAMVRRGMRGWDDSDVWSMDHYLARILPPMLRSLADNSHGAPTSFLAEGWDDPSLNIASVGDPLDDGFVKYQKWLRELAAAFEEWNKLNEEGPYHRWFTDEWHEEMRLLEKEQGFDAWFDHEGPLERASEEEKQQAKAEFDAQYDATKKHMHELIEHFDDLWD